MKKILFILFLVLFYSCGSQKFFTDTFIIKMKNNTTDTLKHSYWTRFDMDHYKMEWLLKKEGINPDSVDRISFNERKVLKIKKKDL
jgi:hypothetical protein